MKSKRQKNPVAKILRTPRFKARRVESKKRYVLARVAGTDKSAGHSN